MRTKIYYFGLKPEVQEFLEGKELQTKLEQKGQELELVTASTALLTAIKSKRDLETSFFFVGTEQVDKWEQAGNLDKYMPKATARKIETVKDLKSCISKKYSVEFAESEKVASEEETENKPLKRKTKVEQKDTKRENEKAKEQEKEQNKLQEQKKEKSFFEDPRDKEIDIKVGTESNIVQNLIYNSGNRKHQLRGNENKDFVLWVYQDTKSEAVTQTIDTGGFEITANQSVKQLEEYRSKINELLNKIQNIKKSYRGYKTPQEVDELIKAYNQISDKYDDLGVKYNEIMSKGDPNTKKALELERNKNKKLEQVNDKYKKDNNGLYLDSKKILREKDDIKDKYKKVKIELDNLKNKMTSKDDEGNNIDNYIEGNISLSRANQKLREKIKEEENERKEMKRQLVELKQQQGISQLNVPVGKNYSNITVYVGINSSGQYNFYNNILKNYDYTSNKRWLVDLGRTSKIDTSISLKKYSNPNLYLEGKKTIQEVLSDQKNSQYNNMQVVTSILHGVNRGIFNITDWNKVLEELNQDRTMLYLGDLENTEVFNLIKELQKNKNNIRVIVVMGEEAGISNSHILNGLYQSNIYFAGEQGINYQNLQINLRY